MKRIRRPLESWVAGSIAVMLAWATEASAIAVGLLDTFQSGTTLDWVEGLGGAIAPIPPAVVANAGPGGSGDFALRITGTGSLAGAGGCNQGFLRDDALLVVVVITDEYDGEGDPEPGNSCM